MTTSASQRAAKRSPKDQARQRHLPQAIPETPPVLRQREADFTAEGAPPPGCVDKLPPREVDAPSAQPKPTDSSRGH